MVVEIEKSVNVRDSVKIEVGEEWNKNSIRISVGNDSFLMRIKWAVKLWRCLTGEIDKSDIRFFVPLFGLCDQRTMHVSYSENDAGFKWTLDTGRYKVMLDEDEALALAWAIRDSVSHAISERDNPGVGTFQCETKEIPLKVWVLAARRMLTGDCAENGVDQLGGCEQVYLTEEAARDAVREFMRPLVNDLFGETYWENRTVDDELDDIMAATDANKTDVWILDGQKQAFEVELTEREVLT